MPALPQLPPNPSACQEDKGGYHGNRTSLQTSTFIFLFPPPHHRQTPPPTTTFQLRNKHMHAHMQPWGGGGGAMHSGSQRNLSEFFLNTKNVSLFVFLQYCLWTAS
ncbi:hypothetical protein FQA47_023350 [Oryzias melastigma]|uniref:Uncharacterized protein n=1 Tax=Oryzias melastigma TaxID=30732 RepID=A0A834CJ71_ORYME|nr:hypothetical protein FQA47_023350 [Oryzias melastigma]